MMALLKSSAATTLVNVTEMRITSKWGKDDFIKTVETIFSKAKQDLGVKLRCKIDIVLDHIARRFDSAR